MTRTQIDAMLVLVGQLWPRCKWSKAEAELLAEKLDGLNIADAQWRAVVREHRATPDGDKGTPRLSALVTRLRETDRGNRQAPAAGAEVNRQRQWRETPEERALVERGDAASLAWVRAASDEELEAARAALERLTGEMWGKGRQTRAHLEGNAFSRGLLHAASRMARREVLS